MSDVYRIFPKLDTSNKAVRSVRTAKFGKLFDKLPPDVQGMARAAFESWKTNPSLIHFKPLESYQGDIYSAQIGYRHRAMARKSMDDQGRPVYVWFFIGSHETYNQLCKGGRLDNEIESGHKKRKIA